MLEASFNKSTKTSFIPCNRTRYARENGCVQHTNTLGILKPLGRIALPSEPNHLGRQGSENVDIKRNSNPEPRDLIPPALPLSSKYQELFFYLAMMLSECCRPQINRKMNAIATTERRCPSINRRKRTQSRGIDVSHHKTKYQYCINFVCIKFMSFTN